MSRRPLEPATARAVLAWLLPVLAVGGAVVLGLVMVVNALP